MTSNFMARPSIAATALLVIVGALSARAMNVQPLALEMVTIGSNSRTTIQAVNDGAQPMPVEVAIKKLDIALDGKTTETPAGKNSWFFRRKP